MNKIKKRKYRRILFLLKLSFSRNIAALSQTKISSKSKGSIEEGRGQCIHYRLLKIECVQRHCFQFNMHPLPLQGVLKTIYVHCTAGVLHNEATG